MSKIGVLPPIFTVRMSSSDCQGVQTDRSRADIRRFVSFLDFRGLCVPKMTGEARLVIHLNKILRRKGEGSPHPTHTLNF
jgi:hypothetical protein